MRIKVVQNIFFLIFEAKTCQIEIYFVLACFVDKLSSLSFRCIAINQSLGPLWLNCSAYELQTVPNLQYTQQNFFLK